jgi:hypothetical protein
MISRHNIRHSTEALAYWTSCAIATYEEAVYLKSTPLARVKRLRSIADGMRRHLEEFSGGDIAVGDLQDLKTRLEEANAEGIARFGAAKFLDP